MGLLNELFRRRNPQREAERILQNNPKYDFPVIVTSSIFGLLFCIGFFTWALWDSAVTIKRNEAIHTWPSTVGEVTTAKVQKRTKYSDKDYTKATGEEYWPQVEVTYSDGKDQYLSRRYSLDKEFIRIAFAHKSEAQAFLQPFTNHKPVRVYYDPENHGYGIVSLSPVSWIWSIVLALIFFFLWAICSYMYCSMGLMGTAWLNLMRRYLPYRTLDKLLRVKHRPYPTA